MDRTPLTIKLESGVELTLPFLDSSYIEKAEKKESWAYTEPECPYFIYEFAFRGDRPYIIRSDIF